MFAHRIDQLADIFIRHGEALAQRNADRRFAQNQTFFDLMFMLLTPFRISRAFGAAAVRRNGSGQKFD